MTLPNHVVDTAAAMRMDMTAAKLAQGITSLAVVDILGKQTQADAWNLMAQNAGTYINRGILQIDAIIAAAKKNDSTFMLSNLLTEYKAQMDLASMLMRAGIFAGLGASLTQFGEGMMGTNTLAYYFKDLRMAVALKPWMIRTYNAMYSPGVLSVEQAWKAYRQKVWTQADFQRVLSYDGFDKNSAVMLEKVFSKLPSSGEAWWLWRKGLIGEDQLAALYFAEGWDPAWNSILTENNYRLPSLMNLTRIADTVSLGQTWTIKQLKKMGFNDEDAAKLWDYLDARPVMTEQRAVASQWLWRYTNSRCTLKELTDALKTLSISTREINLLVTKAQLQREDELITEWVTILTWRFRIAVIDEAEFMAGLEELGITHEKANLIVETQKAMGYLGGYGGET